MSEDNAQQEPTMEEILASIRRIISEDSDEGAAEPSGDVAAHEASDDGAVFDLNEPVSETPQETYAEDSYAEEEVYESPVVEEATVTFGQTAAETHVDAAAEPTYASSEPAYEPEQEYAPEPQIFDEPEPVQEPEVSYEAEPSHVAEVVSEPEFEPEVVHETVAETQEPEESAAVSELLSQTAAGAAAASFEELSRVTPVSAEPGASLEDLTKAMLKPMLKDWLDQYLPGIVEDMVRQEIERVSKRGG